MQNGSHAGTTRTVAIQPPVSWASQAANERLSSTLFLAGLFHAIVILGVTFSVVPDAQPPGTITDLDVVLVNRDYEREVPPDDAEVLSRQNLSGSGTTLETERLRSAARPDDDAARPGPDQDGTFEERPRGTPQPSRQRLVVTTSGDADTVDRDAEGSTSPEVMRQRIMPPNAQTAIEILSEPDDETAVSGAASRELIISPNTRESRIAAYLSNWKVKVERVGTLNFPNSASKAGAGRYPTLEVALRADGRLKEVIVRNSSGRTDLDQAAMDILRSAAPFDPFPEFLRSDYDVLRFAYEWHFTAGGQVGRISSIGGS